MKFSPQKRKGKTENKKGRPSTSSKSSLKKGASRKRSWIRRGFIIFLWALILILGGVAYLLYDLPPLGHLEPAERTPSITLMTQKGDILATYGDLQARPVPLEALPPHLPKAVVSIEDKRFYDHGPLDFVSIIRASWSNLRAGRVVQGGSSLTQQLAKNLFLSSERSWKRKLQELLLSIWLEIKFTKDEILGIYLSRVYLGGGVYGVSAAAHKFFRKPVSQVTLAESAILAGALKAPTHYGPMGSTQKAKERAHLVLKEMHEQGIIGDWEYTEASVELEGHSKRSAVAGTRYFTDWVVSEVQKILKDLPAQDVWVTTTFDPALQEICDQAIEDQLRSKDFDELEVAMLVLAPEGAVRAMIGGRSYDISPFNRATQAKRQPGSAFKVLVYLAALQKGLHASSLIADTPVRLGKWMPNNFHWESRGEIPLWMALAYSVNTCAARLIQRVGLPAINALAQELGVPLQAKDLTVALGTGEVTLIDLSRVFATVANGGFRVDPYGILQIRTQDGKILFQHPSSHTRVLSSQVVQEMTHMLRAVVQQGTGKRAQLPGLPVAGKTGTTQHRQDAWFVGFLPNIITGVWVGVDRPASGEKSKRSLGGRLPAQLWQAAMERMVKKK